MSDATRQRFVMFVLVITTGIATGLVFRSVESVYANFQELAAQVDRIRADKKEFERGAIEAATAIANDVRRELHDANARIATLQAELRSFLGGHGIGGQGSTGNPQGKIGQPGDAGH